MNKLHTRIWQEEAEADNPFATRRARCHGFDVYGQMLGHARWVDIVHVLFCGQAPSPSRAALLDALAVALANPGPRDPSVHAAMCGGIGGSSAAASLMAALAVGAGASGGAREVRNAMDVWLRGGDSQADWEVLWGPVSAGSESSGLEASEDIWPAVDHPAGWDPHGVSLPLIVRQTLAACAACDVGPRVAWLHAREGVAHAALTRPLALTGVAAAAFVDLGLSPAQGEMLFLLLRLPGAAVHALEQGGKRYVEFPFPSLDLRDDPLNKEPV